MPQVKWEWSFSPQFIVSSMNFFVVFLGVVGLWFKMQADVSQAKDTVAELRAAVIELTKAQTGTSERLTRVETQIQVVVPALNRIEERQLRPIEPIPPPRGR